MHVLVTRDISVAVMQESSYCLSEYWLQRAGIKDAVSIPPGICWHISGWFSVILVSTLSSVQFFITVGWVIGRPSAKKPAAVTGTAKSSLLPNLEKLQYKGWLNKQQKCVCVCIANFFLKVKNFLMQRSVIYWDLSYSECFLFDVSRGKTWHLVICTYHPSGSQDNQLTQFLLEIGMACAVCVCKRG